MILCPYSLINSARSKVRGTLEIYHAFIRDLDSSRTDNEWEIVDSGSVSVSIAYSYILSVMYFLHDIAEYFFFQKKVTTEHARHFLFCSLLLSLVDSGFKNYTLLLFTL